MCSWFPAITPLLPVLPLHCLLSLMHRKVSDGVRSPPRPCLPSDETEGNSKFDSSLCFCKTGRKGAHCFFPHPFRCAEKRGKPKRKGEKLSLPIQPPHVMALTCPKHCPYVFICSWHPLLQLCHDDSSVLPLCCSSPQACRTLTVLPLFPRRHGQKQEAQKEQIKAEESLTHPQKMPRGEGEEACCPAIYSRCLNKGLPWVCA